jgi:hypothetical protein
MPKIFVNYRRQQDGGWAADSISTRLQTEFGADHVFLDVRSIRPSADWADTIQSEITQAPAFVVLLGKDWHKVQDEETGDRRIKEDDDWVRREIRTALDRQIPIFIVLLDGARVPEEKWLPEDIRPFLRSQAWTVRQSNVETDLEPVLEELATRTGIARARSDSSGRSRLAFERPVWKAPTETTDAVASRAPIVIAIEEKGAPIKEQELLAAERHLTVTLREEDAATLRSIQARLGECKSVDAIVDLGSDAWAALTSASPLLDEVLKAVAGAETAEESPQPVAWTGRAELLTAIYRAILIACPDHGAKGPPFATVTYGAHYFHPLATDPGARGMQPREWEAESRVKIGKLEPTLRDEGALPAVDNALKNEVVLVSSDNVDGTLEQIVNQLPRHLSSPTRVVLGFGLSAVDPSSIQAALALVPCVGLAGPALRDQGVVREVKRALSAGLDKQAVPVVVARVRRAIVADQVSKPANAIDLALLLDALTWSTWAWVGRPLFSKEFGEVKKAAYPHLMDLRDVASRDWYYDRFADIPRAYRTSALTAREPERQFHLYLSGAGGTGKSCFLRSIHDTLEINNTKVLPVWYKVHAPSSEWSDVASEIKNVVRKALEKRLGVVDRGLLSEADELKELDVFLLDLLEKLRERKTGIDQIALFVDQLERTFESGENPELGRLTAMSAKVVTLLDSVGVDNGVRVFIASRKQYLADFLSSFEKAEYIKLHFNVLQSLSVEREGTPFVNRIITWCSNKKLIGKLDVSPGAARVLADEEQGHPLNMMLALIELLSRRDLPEEISESTIRKLSPWTRRFHVDEALMGKDDLDWYFFLAMAHAQTEIVRREEVLWRLALVSRELAAETKRLGPLGVLERLWLVGHLGRTMHPRPQGNDAARFLEFFHANLRDHLLTNVMNRAEQLAAAEAGDSRPRRRGMPPAWRALDRLREIARDWEHVQQPLVKEDITALMDRKEVFTGRIQVTRGDRSVEVESFYLLFMRDVEDRRDIHFQAAKECVAYSALVHDVHGRWAFKTLFPNVADDMPTRRGGELDDSQVACCRRWLRPTRADSQSRLRILHYLVELRDTNANRLLAEIVFDRSGDDEPWQQLARILADPLVAATHRGAFLTYLVQYLLDAGIGVAKDSWHTQRLGAFLVTTCGDDRDELSHVLDTLPKEVAVIGDPRLEPAVRHLVSADRVDRWLGVAVSSAAGLAGERELREGLAIELRVGEQLAAHVDQGKFDRWVEEVAARLSVPLPRVGLSRGEVSNHRFTEEVSRRDPPPAGYELQLVVRGRLVGLGRFFPDRVQTLTRDWDGADAVGAIPCFNEALWEPVRWVEPSGLTQGSWPHPSWTFDQAATDWLEDLLRRHIRWVFSYDDVYPYLSHVAETAGSPRLAADLQYLSNVLYPVGAVVANLVRERAPLAERGVDVLGRLIEIVREDETFDVGSMTLRLREHIGNDLCRTFVDASNQLFVLLLDQADERWLLGKLRRTPTRMLFDRITPEEAKGMIGAVRERFEEVARADHVLPVIVCDEWLRAPLFDMLQRFDPRIFVLSYTELSPEVRLTSRGVIRRFIGDVSAS